MSRAAMLDAAKAIAQAITEANRRNHKPASIRRVSDGYNVCCPAHPDSQPSLHVWVQPSGRFGIYLHCFAGCTWRSLMDAIPDRAREILGGLRRDGHPILRSYHQEGPGGLDDDGIETTPLPPGYHMDAKGVAWWPKPLSRTEAWGVSTPQWRILREPLQLERREGNRIICEAATVHEIWPYRIINDDEDPAARRKDPTRVAGYKVRYKVYGEELGKTYRCFSFWANMHSDKVVLRRAALAKPRPLYGNHRSLRKPRCWILTEGEKSADMASRLFAPDAEGVCSFSPQPNSLHAALAENDMRPLGKLPICIFPDLDGPGEEAARRWMEVFRIQGRENIYWVDPKSLPFHKKDRGSDLGDCENDEHTRGQVRRWRQSLEADHPLRETRPAPQAGTSQGR